MQRPSHRPTRPVARPIGNSVFPKPAQICVESAENLKRGGFIRRLNTDSRRFREADLGWSFEVESGSRGKPMIAWWVGQLSLKPVIARGAQILVAPATKFGRVQIQPRKFASSKFCCRCNKIGEGRETGENSAVGRRARLHRIGRAGERTGEKSTSERLRTASPRSESVVPKSAEICGEPQTGRAYPQIKHRFTPISKSGPGLAV